MGCASSTGTSTYPTNGHGMRSTPAYPGQTMGNPQNMRKGYHTGYPNGYVGPVGTTGGGMDNTDAMLLGGAAGYMAGSYMAGGGGHCGMGMGMGTDLPGGYHIGPQMPTHDVTVMGVDVL
ncbi:unnamed protein product [Owenia fusiformis]|uniref:Uncharacterized protein n=1 Tax=Owenia fusiformis TaxID=6347 RepID=A0A8J1TG31_OWEFU|nr:unnamed protein product [Owenia fusiformis]